MKRLGQVIFIAAVLYWGIAATVHTIRYPDQTQMRRLLNIVDVLLFR